MFNLCKVLIAVTIAPLLTIQLKRLCRRASLAIVALALVSQSLCKSQTESFAAIWNHQMYHKMAGKLNHRYSYIKDVGAEMWKLLRQKGIPVTKLNAQQKRYLPALLQCNCVEWGKAPDVSEFYRRKAQLATLEH